MCRFARLHGLPVQHAAVRSHLGFRHPSSLRFPDRSIAVANTRSSPDLANPRHASQPLNFPFHNFSGLARFSNCTPVQLVRSPSSSQNFARDIGSAWDTDEMAMAVKTEAPNPKLVDILNTDTALPAGQAAATLDPESDEDIPVEAEELKEALGRPPPVNSSYLPLPWEGRLGYVSDAPGHCRSDQLNANLPRLV